MTFFLLTWAAACLVCLAGATLLVWFERDYVDRTEDRAEDDAAIEYVRMGLHRLFRRVRAGS